MLIQITGCSANFPSRGVDLSVNGGVEGLTTKLQAILPITQWGYSPSTDIMDIEVPNGTAIPPSLSTFGVVSVVNDI